ncbi:uncharacterized protein LOC131859191 [Cryptomeria japonica]|uniref:uncharacterized protein LOC131859191 n=1 Tax=Cryptomeria japonica TaxID=3369 RepID=UPI0027DA3860|nr:uncharacterized protein LOC131859191 [Cryptomeria japonica]
MPSSDIAEYDSRRSLSGIKPGISRLRIFGCPVYVHVPKDKRTKLEPSGKRGIFVGYNESSKDYIIYILGQRYIEVSRDITFEEDFAFKKSKGSWVEDEAHPHDMNTDHDLEIQREPSDPEIQREPSEPEMHNDPVEPTDPTDGPRDCYNLEETSLGKEHYAGGRTVHDS